MAGAVSDVANRRGQVMKFVDEVKIDVEAGSGGHGCLSFRRERFVPQGGPDGGDGGRGGDIFLQVDRGLNTLVDFRYTRRFRAANGQSGMGRKRIGKDGADKVVRVPLGTLVYHEATDELIDDLVAHEQRLLVAKGGGGGRGNVHYKSSTNRAPRKTTRGEAGETRTLRLEMRLLADVAVVGTPNAGKSSLVRQVSAARPRVADYPFSTLYPSLGVVELDAARSFVIADIPGLVEGAAGGAGLGIRFLRHLQRTRMLLHVVDVHEDETGHDPVADFNAVAMELRLFNNELYERERWLVVNKIDLVSGDVHSAKQRLCETVGWSGPSYAISALTGEGCDVLMADIHEHLLQLGVNNNGRVANG